MDGQAQKKALRASLRARVSAMPPHHRACASAAVRDAIRASAWWQRARTVLLYAADASEPDVDALIETAHSEGKMAGVCAIDWARKSLHPKGVASASDLIGGKHGVRVPGDGCPALDPSGIDLILVPGVGFDRAGGRLGRGGGFYDRFVAAWRAVCPMESVAVGVGFGVQVVDRVPTDAHDAVLDGLVTDAGVIVRGGPC